MENHSTRAANGLSTPDPQNVINYGNSDQTTDATNIVRATRVHNPACSTSEAISPMCATTMKHGQTLRTLLTLH
eukprot:3234140-Amphidinium_carterae.1